MSLFSSLQLTSNALPAQSIGLQVLGQNIANVNTPGYSSATTVFTPAPTQRVGNLLLGLGVEVDSIKQIVDEHLNSRLRAATADRVGGGDRGGIVVRRQLSRQLLSESLSEQGARTR